MLPDHSSPLRILYVLLGLSFLFPAGGWLAAQWVFKPDNHRVGALPADLIGKTVYLYTADDVTLPAWMIPGDEDKGGVLLLHQRGGSRLSMLGRARYLHGLGYTILMPDFRGEGEGEAALRGLGVAEVEDVRAALDTLKKAMGPRKIAILGISKGAAAAAFNFSDSNVSALVLESVYGNLEEAVTERLVEHWGNWSRPLGYWIAAPLAFGMGAGLELVSPRLALGKLDIPKLIISGDRDNKPTWAQTELTYNQAAEPKELLRIRGAGHENLHQFAREEWEGRVSAFLERNLHGLNPVADVPVPDPETEFADVPGDV